MQNPLQKFILAFLAVFLQATDSKAESPLAQKADSLFFYKNYEESARLYQSLLENHEINRSLTYLKLAYINEHQGNFAKEAFYLYEYMQLRPSTDVFDKINHIAEENSFSGYSRSDFNFFSLFLKQYSIYIYLGILAVSLYIFVVLVFKRNKGLHIPRSHKIGLLSGILLGLLVINFPSFLQSGIVNKPIAFARKGPSSASVVVDSLREGSKVNIIGQKDIWLRVYQNRNLSYIKGSDLSIIAEK
ncbi:SH3 domain-containing protein [Marinilongibacter aquaticus]|uniref:SH3 domain-containing protein n=1 Tax=Marinilongibacter aquaticus TaxID=2975157 RepID=UPI0021BDCEC0|nr:SH3 domain-containing protein [Marinilongibacter aquaticus]UBM59601.1 SH3 domain-containing protein [Marinilongibacter aquaticus]